MEMCIRIWLLKILILIIYLPKIYGNVVSFGPDGPVALSEPIILICKINGFEGSADLNRNGALINSCSEVNFCSLGPSRNISNAVFKFEGNGLGIKVTIDPLLPDEVGMRYVCSFNSTDKEYNITISSSGNGGGSTDLTEGLKALIALVVLAGIFIPAIILCCILNTRCKFGDVCKDSPLSFTVPPGNGSRVNFTSKGRIENLTPKSEPDKKKVTPNQEKNSIDKLNNGKSSIATSQPRSGAHQPLNPLIRADGGNGMEKIYQDDETKYDESKKAKREEKKGN